MRSSGRYPPVTRRAAWIAGVVLAVLAGHAHAESRWRAGLDLHGTDAAFGGRRALGVAAALRLGPLEWGVVVDPTVLISGWQVIDVTAGRWIGDRFELLAGWRQTSDARPAGRRYDEAVLLGADLVAASAGPLRIAFGVEATASILRHGGDLPPDMLRPHASAEELATRFELMLHARFELAR